MRTYFVRYVFALIQNNITYSLAENTIIFRKNRDIGGNSRSLLIQSNMYVWSIVRGNAGARNRAMCETDRRRGAISLGNLG